MLRGRTRVQYACQRCRRQKIKCSGVPPCRTCRGRGLKCDFGAEDKTVLISEKELLDLRSRVSQLEKQCQDCQDQHGTPGGGRPISRSCQSGEAGGIATPCGPAQLSATLQESSSSILDAGVDQSSPKDTEYTAQIDVTNPLVPGRPAYILQGPTGILRYLGHSSPYAFTQQVLHMLQQDSPSNPSPEILPSSDGPLYRSESYTLVPLATPDVSRLPSKGIALHYLQTINFRTQPLFYLFDEVNFGSRLQMFYRDAFSFAQANPVWYVHYLLLMAFGRALDPYEQLRASSASPVSEYFTRALSLLPDMSYLYDHYVEAAEIFSCIALYLQSIDHRSAALIYVGLALRTAQLHALHLDLQESVVGHHDFERGRRVWWTVYSLNQKITSNLGLSNFLNEHDVTSPAPSLSDSDEDATAWAIHVKICQLLGVFINRVYGTSERDRSSFVANTRTILKGAAGIANELRQYSENCFGEISRVAAHLELAYHQCIILACRPALFCLLKMRSETWRGLHTSSPSTALTGLIQVCIDSATQAVHMLNQLMDHNLLDTFLPFDLECAFSAAFVLIMASYVHPRVLPPTHSIQNGKAVIDAIAARGNAQANFRSLEIGQLEEMLSRQVQQLPENRRFPEVYDTDTVALENENGHRQIPNYGDLFFDAWDFGTGFSGHQMMDLADAISTGDFDLLDQ